MMNARFVRNDEIAAVAVVKNSNDCGMSAVEDADHAAFSANGRAGGLAPPGVPPLNACDHAISVHGVSQLIGRNEKIAIQISSRRVGHHKAVTIAMRDEAPGKQIRVARRGLWSRSGSRIRFCGGSRLGSLARETITAASHFLHQAPALQPR